LQCSLLWGNVESDLGKIKKKRTKKDRVRGLHEQEARTLNTAKTKKEEEAMRKKKKEVS